MSVCVECVGVSQCQGVAETVLKISHVVAIKMPESDSGTDWLTHWRGQHLPSILRAAFLTATQTIRRPTHLPSISLPPCELRHSMFHMLLLRVFLFWGGNEKFCT